MFCTALLYSWHVWGLFGQQCKKVCTSCTVGTGSSTCCFNLLLQKLGKRIISANKRWSNKKPQYKHDNRIFVRMYLYKSLFTLDFIFFDETFYSYQDGYMGNVIGKIYCTNSFRCEAYIVRHILSIRYIATAPFISPIAWFSPNLLFSRRNRSHTIYSYCFPFRLKGIFKKSQKWAKVPVEQISNKQLSFV